MPTFGGFLPAAYPPHCVCTLAHCPTLHILEVKLHPSECRTLSGPGCTYLAWPSTFFFFFLRGSNGASGQSLPSRKRAARGSSSSSSLPACPPPLPNLPLVGRSHWADLPNFESSTGRAATGVVNSIQDTPHATAPAPGISVIVGTVGGFSLPTFLRSRVNRLQLVPGPP